MVGELDAAAERAFGCVFCMTGKEQAAASNLEKHWDIARARPVSVLKWRTTQGRKSLNPEVVFPSYVFFEASGGFEPTYKMPDDCLKVLRNGDGDWRLSGRDAWFARWLLDQDGEIGLSEARKVGDRIQIQRGPLKDIEGSIVRLDRRGRSCLVDLEINGRTLRTWLAFELMEDESAMRNAALRGGISQPEENG